MKQWLHGHHWALLYTWKKRARDFLKTLHMFVFSSGWFSQHVLGSLEGVVSNRLIDKSSVKQQRRKHKWTSGGNSTSQWSSKRISGNSMRKTVSNTVYKRNSIFCKTGYIFKEVSFSIVWRSIIQVRKLQKQGWQSCL